jgi:hypothetical protein
MKKKYLTVLALLVASLAAPTFQSSAMVPLPESIRQPKDKEKVQPVDPNTTVIESGKIAIFPPTQPPALAIFPPTNPPYAIV